MSETKFGGLTGTFKIMKRKVENMPAADVQSFRHDAFYQFVADMLDWFELFPALQVVKVSHTLTHDVRNAINTTIEGQHELYVIAPEADMDPDAAPEKHENYVRDALPYSVMGNGTFEIFRDDKRVQRFLELDSVQAAEWTGIVANIANEMDRAFGTIRTVHTLV